MLPLLPGLGITRLAKVTGLDRIGIPVWMAVRPNARNLSVSQGKGLTDGDARASAIMEATELCVAEAPWAPTVNTSARALREAGKRTIDTKRSRRRGEADLDVDEEAEWIEGFDLLAEVPVWVPLELVTVNADQNGRAARGRFRQTSDGLASGNVLLEAVLHGLCERIERDALCLWSFRSDRQIAERCIDPDLLEDESLSECARRFAQAGLRFRLFDITSDIGVPTYFAVVGPQLDELGANSRFFDVAGGSGTHPDPVRAALRAVTEAAQTRLTTISGARDDFLPEKYLEPLPISTVYLRAEPSGRPPDRLAERPASRTLPEDLPHVVERLRTCGIGSAVIVPLGGDATAFAVAKAVVPDLENSPDTKEATLGRRAVRAMMGRG